jgi:hypothetical protein
MGCQVLTIVSALAGSGTIKSSVENKNTLHPLTTWFALIAKDGKTFIVNIPRF